MLRTMTSHQLENPNPSGKSRIGRRLESVFASERQTCIVLRTMAFPLDTVDWKPKREVEGSVAFEAMTSTFLLEDRTDLIGKSHPLRENFNKGFFT